MTGCPRRVLVVARLAPLFGLTVSKGSIVWLRHVTQVAYYVHHLVIAEQGYNVSSGFASFGLQRHQQVHGLASLSSAVDNITGLNERSAAPTQ